MFYIEKIELFHEKERASPAGNSGQRRPSRSPRSQRSRSADVDCLKKYTERRVEERRHTEIGDTNKLDTTRWMPLPRNVPRGHQSGAKRPSRDERQESVDETTAVGEKRSPPCENRFPRNELEAADRPQLAGRSHSTDVTALKSVEKRSITEQRRHTDCSDPRTIATRWIGQNNETKFYREISPLARIGCEITKSATTRWMTFVKNPSPSPIPRVNSERRSSKEYDRKDEEEHKDSDSSKWQPSRKFSPAKSEKGHLQRQDEIDIRDRSSSIADANERANKLSQRMRDLYDFKTENEWPKRAGSSPRENSWISKSSSEEERNNYQPVRRNSQDLEFNDRFDGFKLKAQHEEDRRRPQRSTHDASEVFDDTEDERLRRFNDRVRYCEDRGKVRARGRERRTYSDDYDEKVRRESRLTRHSEPPPIKRDRPEAPLAIKRLADKENKRNSDVSMRSRDSRVSYAEIDFQKRDSRPSDASYASVTLCKRGSVECRSTQKILDAPPRRAFSQSDERPATPVPPIEFNDERYVPKKLPESPKRDSTRYKVYLT
ncbi:trichohyalin-like [Linepithema humile]|uniref:trichohyalin-like n=1 Tax=Linepithema humile TaxID=83485 RepID=UPI0006237FED|nr:PREDICTED: stress response protein NST1-like [Linepithema humile]